MGSVFAVALPRVNQVTGPIVTGAMKVHSQLGPGFAGERLRSLPGSRVTKTTVAGSAAG